MRKIKRPKKSLTPSLDKRVKILLEIGVTANQRMDYLVTHVSELVKNQLAQDGALDLIYDVLIEMGLPWHAKLWRWVKGKVKRCRTES